MAFVAPAVRYPDSLNSSLDSLVAPIRASLGEAFKDVPSLLILAPLLLLPVVLLALNNSTGSARRRVVTAAPVPVKSRGTPAVLLAGPSSSGKTSLWHALSLRIACNDAIPAAHTSQLISRCEAKVDGRNVKLIDAPGHARLRHLEETQVGKADAVVFCIDVGAARGQGEAMREAADHLHNLLTVSLKRKTPLSLLVLFTRADLSPLLSADASDPKRRNAALQRAKLALETEMTRRRAGLGGTNGANVAAKVGSLRAVARENTGFVASVLKMLGLSAGTQGASTQQQEDDEEDSQSRDYVQWSGPNGTSSGFSLEKLDDEVVTAGAAQCALASVGKTRGWMPKGDEAVELKEERTEWDGLRELREWCSAV